MFANNNYNGKGILLNTDDSKNEGTFKDGQLDGQGEQTLGNGDYYKGNFTYDTTNYIMKFQGTVSFKNGDKYVG